MTIATRIAAFVGALVLAMLLLFANPLALVSAPLGVLTARAVERRRGGTLGWELALAAGAFATAVVLAAVLGVAALLVSRNPEVRAAVAASWSNSVDESAQQTGTTLPALTPLSVTLAIFVGAGLWGSITGVAGAAMALLVRFAGRGAAPAPPPPAASTIV